MTGIPSHMPPPQMPPINPRTGKAEDAPQQQPARPVPAQTAGVSSGPQMTPHAQTIAAALAQAAAKAKEKELAFEEIVQRVIDLTNITDPQAAMEEANRKLQQEIENSIEAIKKNKGLMEEAEAWEEFAQILDSEMSEDQVDNFLGLLNEAVKNI